MVTAKTNQASDELLGRRSQPPTGPVAFRYRCAETVSQNNTAAKEMHALKWLLMGVRKGYAESAWHGRRNCVEATHLRALVIGIELPTPRNSVVFRHVAIWPYVCWDGASVDVA